MSREKDGEESRRVQEQKPGTRKFVRGVLCRRKEAKVTMKNRIWRTKFCPGSSDGRAERAKLIRKKARAPPQTLQLMTTPGFQESIPTQTATRARVGTVRANRQSHTLLVETRARDLDREVYQDPDSDRYLIPSERVFDNSADDLETIAISKRLISLLPAKEVVRTDLQPFRQENTALAKIWCVKMKDDTHLPNELNSQMRVMKTYLKARYRLSDLLRAQRIDSMTSNLKMWIENGTPRRREEDKVLYKYNAIVLPQLYQTELLFCRMIRWGTRELIRNSDTL